MHMLRKAHDLRGCGLTAKDGEIGKVLTFLFDEETWTVRYMLSRPEHGFSNARFSFRP